MDEYSSDASFEILKEESFGFPEEVLNVSEEMLMEYPEEFLFDDSEVGEPLQCDDAFDDVDLEMEFIDSGNEPMEIPRGEYWGINEGDLTPAHPDFKGNFTDEAQHDVVPELATDGGGARRPPSGGVPGIPVIEKNPSPPDTGIGEADPSTNWGIGEAEYPVYDVPGKYVWWVEGADPSV